MAIDILLSMGTNTILATADMDVANRLAFPALFLETYDGTGDFGLVPVNSGPTSRDLMGGGDRDVIRFYSKRSTSCKVHA